MGLITVVKRMKNDKLKCSKKSKVIRNIKRDKSRHSVLTLRGNIKTKMPDNKLYFLIKVLVMF